MDEYPLNNKKKLCYLFTKIVPATEHNYVIIKSIVEIDHTEYFLTSHAHLENGFLYIHEKQPIMKILKRFSDLLGLELKDNHYFFHQNCLIGLGNKIR